MSKKKKFDYFDAFEKQTEIAIKEAELLIETIENFTSADKLDEPMAYAHNYEHDGDVISHDIFKTIATDFITPFDREDIIGLSQNLDTIIDLIEEVMQLFYMYDIHEMHEQAITFAKYIKKCCVALSDAMSDFRNFKKSKKFKHLIVQVNTYEEEADGLYMEVIRGLHTNDRERPMRVHVWSGIFERMEECCDACEHAADAMSTILLKNV